MFEVVLKYYSILENNFKIIEQKNSIFIQLKMRKYKIVLIDIEQLVKSIN